ncbi:MAG: hypothetical protein KBD76_00460 [Bacteriovorax sp.]|nr:hypothetical protein [Bacteriovorax sp.]
MVNKYARNILYLLPTRDWSTKERFAFRDIVLAKKHGYNIYLCTYENSFLASFARSLEIEIIPFKEHFFNRFLSFHKHFPLSHINKIAKIDIVHCYDFNLLFSLSVQLKAENLTALVITQDHVIDKPLQRFWYRPLISRIDSLILANKNLIQDAVGNLGLPLKKIEYFGMGIKMEGASEPEVMALNFDLYKDYFLAGTYVSPEISDIFQLTPLLSALKVLNEKLPGGKKCKLILISAVEFKSINILPHIVQQIQEQELEEDVLFVTTKDIVGVITHLNLWISNGAQELIEDFAISALMNEVPAILARNFCTKDLIEEFEGVGETYKLFDARELRDKWEKIILGNAVFKEKTRLYKYFIEKEHSYKTYKTQLLSLYSRTVLRRARLFRKK